MIQVLELKKGISNFAVLIFITTSVTLLILFNDYSLSVANTNAIFMKNHVQKVMLLNKKTLEIKRKIEEDNYDPCKELPIRQEDHKEDKRYKKNKIIKYLNLISLDDGKREGTNYFIPCEEKNLIYNRPSVKIIKHKVSDYISDNHSRFDYCLDNIDEFKDENGRKIPVLNKNKKTKVIFLQENEDILMINGDINAVIISLTNLKIVGKGKIKGSVIVQGNLDLEEMDKKEKAISYNQTVVSEAIEKCRSWEMVNKKLKITDKIPNKDNNME